MSMQFPSRLSQRLNQLKKIIMHLQSLLGRQRQNPSNLTWMQAPILRFGLGRRRIAEFFE